MGECIKFLLSKQLKTATKKNLLIMREIYSEVIIKPTLIISKFEYLHGSSTVEIGYIRSSSRYCYVGVRFWSQQPFIQLAALL